MLIVKIKDLQKLLEDLRIDDVFFAYKEDQTFVVETFPAYEFHKFIIEITTSYNFFRLLIEDLLDAHESFTS